MDDDIYDGFDSIGDGSRDRSQLSSAMSPGSAASFCSGASDSRTFVRPASSMASARNTTSARPASSLSTARQLLTESSAGANRYHHHQHGEMDEEPDVSRAAVERVFLDSVCLGAEGKIEEVSNTLLKLLTALEKSKEAMRLCNRLRHGAQLHQGDGNELSSSSLIFKVNLHYGYTLALAGKFRQAEKTFANLLRNCAEDDGDRATVNTSLAMLYQENGDYDKALQIWLTLFDDNVFVTGSERNFLISQLTVCYTALGRYDLAFKYNEIVAEANDNHRAAFQRILFLVKKDAAWEMIQEVYHKLLLVRCLHCSAPFRGSASCAYLIRDATQLMLTMGATAEWIEDELTRSSWQSVATEMELRRCFDLLENGDVHQVLERIGDFDCLDLGSDLQFKVSTLLCWIYFQLSLFEQCLEHATKAHAAVPEDPSGQLNLGCAHFALGNYDTALQYLSDMATEESSLINKQLLYKGLILKAAGRNEEALSTMLSLEPPWTSDIALEISELQSLLGDTTSALHTLLGVRVDSEDNVTLLSRIGSLAAVLGDDVTAAWHYNRAHNLDPTDLTVIDWLARYSVEKDAPEKAVQLYLKASSIEPESPKWQVLVAVAMRRAGRVTEAFDLCLKVHQTHPEDVTCLQLLLNLCRKLNIPPQESLQYRAKLEALQEQQCHLEEVHHAAGDLRRSPTPSLFSRMSLARPGSCMSLRPASSRSVPTGRPSSVFNEASSCSGKLGVDSIQSTVRFLSSTLPNRLGKDEEIDLPIDDLLPLLG